MVAYYLAFDLFDIDWGGDKHVFMNERVFIVEALRERK
jgi:hypothetical protein